LDPAFDDRVHLGHLNTTQDDVDAGVGEDVVEQLRELVVSVADQEPRGGGVLEVHDEVAGGLSHPCRGWMWCGAEDVDPAVCVSIRTSTYIRAPVRVTVSKKSQARRASAWERRNWAQVLDARAGAGSMPASVRICHTVEAATCRPRTRSSPWMRR
jgi:hypothetical protein